MYANGVPQVMPDVPVQAQIVGGLLQSLSGQPVKLLANLQSGLTLQSGTGFWWWTATVTINGADPDTWSFQLGTSPGSTELYATKNTPAGGSYLPLPTGTPSAGQVPVATGTGEASAWGTIAGGVTSFNGRSGAVVPTSGDYTAAEVGAVATSAVGVTGGVAPLQPWQFPVPAPSGGDDTSAIIAAIRATVAYAQAHNGYGEVIFQAGVYLLNSAPSGGASGFCNAIIPIDPAGTTAQKIILVFRGVRRQAALYHWLQSSTAVQTAGTTLKTVYAGGTTPTLNNEPSMIGGPTPVLFGSTDGGFSNMHIIIDGINLVAPQNPQVAGFDLRRIGEATVVSASALAATTAVGAPQRPDASSGLWAWGLWMPTTGNNDIADIGEWSCEGFVIGLGVDEHVSCDSARVINCYDGLLIQPVGGFPHANRFGYVSSENCFRNIVFNNPNGAAKAVVESLDIEWDATAGGAIVDVVSGTVALGEINVSANGSSGASLSAAMSSGPNANPPVGGLRVVNADMATGHWSGAPAVPGSGSPQLNTAWRDASIVLHTPANTTVTAIAIDGVSTGLTLAAGSSLALPTLATGHSITITYSGTGGAPTWDWWLS